MKYRVGIIVLQYLVVWLNLTIWFLIDSAVWFSIYSADWIRPYGQVWVGYHLFVFSFGNMDLKFSQLGPIQQFVK